MDNIRYFKNKHPNCDFVLNSKHHKMHLQALPAGILVCYSIPMPDDLRANSPYMDIDMPVTPDGRLVVIRKKVILSWRDRLFGKSLDTKVRDTIIKIKNKYLALEASKNRVSSLERKLISEAW